MSGRCEDANDQQPSVEHETERAKLYLQKFCPEAGDSLYDHLSEVLTKVLSERPKDAFASFDEFSRRLRDDKYRARSDRLRDQYVLPPQYAEAKKLIELFKSNLLITNEHEKSEREREQQQGEDEEEEEIEEEEKELAPDLFDLFFYFERTDVGLPRAQITLLNLSIRKLMSETRIKNVRFWGKMLGRPKNYFIVEANLPEDEIENRLSLLEAAEGASLEGDTSVDAGATEAEREKAEREALDVAMATGSPDPEGQEGSSAEEDDGLKLEFPPLPKNTWEPPAEVAAEKLGTGANEKVYFACNSPGLDKWVELPEVTPRQIVVARQIVHFFTGNLEAEIHTFPPFPGSEKNYLRAQIARIGAATQVSPLGYFTLANRRRGQDDEEEEEEGDEEEEEEEEEDEEEEEAEDGEIRVNRRYEAPEMKDLIDPSLSGWCHHSPYLLKQGRVVWQDPSKTGYGDEEKSGSEEDEGDEEEEEEEDEEDEEDEEEEGSEKGQVAEKEVGPAPLTPLSEDADAAPGLRPWTARQSSNLRPDTAVALLRSNIWPGAFAFAANKKFANVYIGWGHKHNAYNYSPPGMPPVEDQYGADAQLVEICDPSFDEEEAYRVAHLPPSDDGEEEEEERQTDSDEIDEDY